MAENYNQNSSQNQDGKQINFLENMRKQRRQRKLRRNLVLLAIVGLGIAYFSGIFSVMLFSGKMFTESIKIALLPAASYPAQTGLSEIYQLEELADGFVARGHEGTVVYSATGNRLRTLQYGYSRPSISVGDDRFLLYQRSGTSLKVESRLETLSEHEFAHPILLAEMSNSGNFAVATEDDNYLAAVTIYSYNMSEILSFYMTANEGAPIGMAFSTNSETLAIATLLTNDGLAVSNIYIVSNNLKDGVLLDTQTGSTPHKLMWISSHELLVIYNTHAVIYDTKQEENAYLSGSYFDFNGQEFLGFDQNDDVFVFLLGSAEQKYYYITDDTFAVLNDGTAQDALDVTLANEALLLTGTDEIICIDLEEYTEQTIPIQTPVIDLLQAQELLIFTKNNADVLVIPTTTAQ